VESDSVYYATLPFYSQNIPFLDDLGINTIINLTSEDIDEKITDFPQDVDLRVFNALIPDSNNMMPFMGSHEYACEWMVQTLELLLQLASASSGTPLSISAPVSIEPTTSVAPESTGSSQWPTQVDSVHTCLVSKLHDSNSSPDLTSPSKALASDESVGPGYDEKAGVAQSTSESGSKSTPQPLPNSKEAADASLQPQTVSRELTRTSSLSLHEPAIESRGRQQTTTTNLEDNSFIVSTGNSSMSADSISKSGTGTNDTDSNITVPNNSNNNNNDNSNSNNIDNNNNNSSSGGSSRRRPVGPPRILLVDDRNECTGACVVACLRRLQGLKFVIRTDYDTQTRTFFYIYMYIYI
jgi:hypothetical protein